MGTQIYYFIQHKKTKFTFIKPDNQHVNKQHDKNFLFLKFLQKKILLRLKFLNYI
jgi:hypothetical protein